MPCSRKETLAKFFFNNFTHIIKFFFLFFYLFTIYFAKLFTFFFRFVDDEYEDESSCEDDEEGEDEKEVEKDEYEYRYSQVEEQHHLVADVMNEGETLVFIPKGLHANEHANSNNNISHFHSNSNESLFQDPVGDFEDDETTVHFRKTSTSSEFELESHVEVIASQNNVDYEMISEEFTSRFETYGDGTLEFISDDKHNNRDECQPVFEDVVGLKSPSFIEIKANGSTINFKSSYYNGEKDESKMKVVKEDATFIKDEKFLIFDPPKSEVKKLLQDIEKENEGIFEDTYTVGSTSKSSSDWRSSMRDSAITDDPFSSSSRRSCPKWESYAVYQKYDEEMMFLDRISAQKLLETESLKSFQVEPRSLSQRVLHKLVHNNKRNTDDEIYKNNSNPYNELQVAYVAQICLAWEALNWNYATFKRKRDSKTKQLEHDCPAHIAQQFQQFQVLLQRYIENEPYQRGKRPEIYARMRSVSPKLLQVPEYHDYDEEEKEDSGGRIESELFLQILEDAIKTFMNFLKADRESHRQLIKNALFKTRRLRGSIDTNVINAIKKHNHKKKLKLKELQRTSTHHICFKKRKLPKEEEMEILMGLIDLKVVSRVLRMADITSEQIHWCEAKMGKHRILDGNLLRDSSPLFFPAH